MSLFKRGKTWWIDFTTPGGKRIKRSAKTKVKREAQEYHDKLRQHDRNRTCDPQFRKVVIVSGIYVFRCVLYCINI